MYYVVHAPLGILISQKTSDIGLIFLLAIISHFILDSIPHGHFSIEKNNKTSFKRIFAILAVDGLISWAIIILLFLKLKIERPLPFFIGIFASALPDLIWIPSKFFKKKNKIMEKYIEFHTKIHFLLYKQKMPLLPGLLLQIMITSVLVYLILQK